MPVRRLMPACGYRGLGNWGLSNWGLGRSRRRPRRCQDGPGAPPAWPSAPDLVRDHADRRHWLAVDPAYRGCAAIGFPDDAERLAGPTMPGATGRRPGVARCWRRSGWSKHGAGGPGRNLPDGVPHGQAAVLMPAGQGGPETRRSQRTCAGSLDAGVNKP